MVFVAHVLLLCSYTVKQRAEPGWDEGLEELLAQGEVRNDSSSSSSSENMAVNVLGLMALYVGVVVLWCGVGGWVCGCVCALLWCALRWC